MFTIKDIINTIDINIKNLDITNKNISSLDGIDLLPNLETIIIDSNPITSLLPLHFLPKLRVIIASKCLLTSLDGIENLKNLQSLYVDNNNIKSLKPILGLKKLSLITFYNNPIEKIYMRNQLYLDEVSNIKPHIKNIERKNRIKLLLE